MASLYRPKIVEYALPDGKSHTPDGKRVTKNTPGAVRTERRSKTWYGRYADAAGKLRRVPLSESKETARRMLRKLLGDAELAGVGIVDPYAEHRARPLAEHLEDYRRFLGGKGDTADHTAKVYARCRAILDGCGWQNLDDLQPSAVVENLGNLRDKDGGVPLPDGERFRAAELAGLLGVRVDSLWRMVRRGYLTCSGRKQGHSRLFLRADAEALLARRRGACVRTCNHYLAAVKGFSRWLVRDGRAPADVLAHLQRQNPDADPRHPRRALKEVAFGKFIEATAGGKALRGLTGTDRLVLYTLAANTGLRAGELASLTPGSFDLDATPPTVTVQAAYSKHRREDVQPLRPDVAAVLRQYLAGRPKGRRVWPGPWPKLAAEMLRGDLAAAGVPYEDGGRYFDFHALRGQFISLMAAAGVHPKVAQVLARHSTITLTMDYYTPLDVFDVAGALDKLPGVRQPQAPADPTTRRAESA